MIELVFGILGAFFILMGAGALRIQGSWLLNLEGITCICFGIFFLICLAIEIKENLEEG